MIKKMLDNSDGAGRLPESFYYDPGDHGTVPLSTKSLNSEAIGSEVRDLGFRECMHLFCAVVMIADVKPKRTSPLTYYAASGYSMVNVAGKAQTWD